jgi:hypothetical protein
MGYGKVAPAPEISTAATAAAAALKVATTVMTVSRLMMLFENVLT